MSDDKRVSTLDSTERAELHRDLRVILCAAHTSNVHIHLPDPPTLRSALELYERLWDHHGAFTGQVVDYARQILPKRGDGTLKSDLEDRPRELLEEQPAHLSITLDEWLEVLTALGDEPEPYLPW